MEMETTKGAIGLRVLGRDWASEPGSQELVSQEGIETGGVEEPGDGRRETERATLLLPLPSEFLYFLLP